MAEKRNKSLITLPFVIGISITVGIFIGNYISVKKTSDKELKFKTLMELIDREYVDSIDTDSLIENILPELLTSLDPHSVYIPKSEVDASNDELRGSFSGVGVTFQIVNDTVTVIEVVRGGPAEKVGLLAGDRIISANGVKMTGKSISNDDVFKNLRGKKGTKVTLKIKRTNSKKTYDYDVIRGEVPINSVDCSYMIADKTGYVKVSKFASNTYQEFLQSILKLRNEGAESFIIDLRGNSGGYMDQAIYMANEFLPKGSLIVYTKGKQPHNSTMAFADGKGTFQKNKITVLTDEYSASASEIFAGALQDNDRGTIVGRRTFGKGLVQNQLSLPDSSAIRLTVARYFTPSGRSIQKDYKSGIDNYEKELLDRYNRGELYNADSVKIDKSHQYKTIGGRIVYGGGGIMPDVFVPEDTLNISSYYINLINSGLIQKYSLNFVDNRRSELKKAKDVNALLSLLPDDNALLENFVAYIVSKGEKARWYYIIQSRERLLKQIKAMIIRDSLGYDASTIYLNRDDATVRKALEQL